MFSLFFLLHPSSPSQDKCQPPPCSLLCVQNSTALASPFYLPISPTCRSSEAEWKPHCVLVPCPSTWHAVYVELCSMENDLGQGNCKLFSGCIFLPRPQRQRRVSVQERGPEGDRRTRKGSREVCVCILGLGRVFVNPQCTQRQ